MREENEFLYGEEETMEIVQKYETMLKHNRSFFFDVIDFENIIDYYLNSDNSKRASEAVDIAYSMHPYSSEIQVRKAELLIIDKKYNEALDILDILVKIEPENGEVFFLKGQAHLEMRNLPMAHEAFWYSTKCYTEDRVDLLYRIASLYQDIEEFNFALRFLSVGYSINNQSLNILFELGYSYERLNELDKSEKYYNQYLDVNPFSSSVWYNIGIV
jgi:tetratricopeptide (TPR) repeat protein